MAPLHAAAAARLDHDVAVKLLTRFEVRGVVKASIAVSSICVMSISLGERERSEVMVMMISHGRLRGTKPQKLPSTIRLFLCCEVVVY